MKNILRKFTSLCLTVVLTLSFSLVASADSPTEIFVDGTPGDVVIDMTTAVSNGDVVGVLETDADPGDISFFEESEVNPTTFRFDVNTNGEIVVARADLISAEGARTRVLGVEAQESFGVTIFQDITINITVPPVAPQFENPANFELLRYEEQGDSAQVFYSEFTTFATDQNADDTLDTLTFTEISCTDNLSNDCSGLFSYSVQSFDDGFGGSNDRVVISQPNFDFEDRAGVDYYDVELEVEDQGGLSSTETYRINNTNLAEVEDATSNNLDGVYGIGDDIFIDVNISDSDTLYYSNQPRDEFFSPIPAVDPTIELQLDSGTTTATLDNLPDDTFLGGSIEFATGDDSFFAGTGPGSPVTFLRFLYTVAEGDSSDDLDYSRTDAIDMGTGQLDDQEFNSDNFDGAYYFETGPGQPVIPIELPEPGLTGSLSFAKDIVIDGIRPFINNARGADVETNHQEGDTIEAIIELNEDVNKSGIDGSSTIDLDIGGTIVTADYDFPLNATLLDNELGFTYIVTAGLVDEDGIDIVTDSFNSNGDVIQDAANNDMTDFTHSIFNLTNDLVGVVEEEVSAPSSSGSGSSGGGGGSTSSPFSSSDDSSDNEPSEEVIEETIIEEVTEDATEEELTEEFAEEEAEVVVEEVIEEPIIIEPTPEPEVFTPEPEPVFVPEINEEPVVEDVIDDEPTEEIIEEEPTEESIEEVEISFNGSLTTGNGNSDGTSPREEIQECEEFDPSTEYVESASFNCDPTEEFIEEEESAPTIQLNLPQDRQSQYNNDDIVIVGKVSDETIERVEVVALAGEQNIVLGVAEVDEAGKFLLVNKVELPTNEDIVVFGRDLDSPTQSPDYGLAINNNIRLIGAELIAFAEKPLERLYESNEEGVDYWTFVSTNVIDNGGLSATVQSELNTNHKAYWQSVLFGSTAITGSNSDQTVLYAPDETIESIQPFTWHTVTILAEKTGANSQPLVVEYFVLPTGFGPGVAILILALLFGGWYLYNKKKNLKQAEALNTTVEA